MNEIEKLEFEAFRQWMFDCYISPQKTGGQVLSLINSGTGKMLFDVWKGAKQDGPPAGMNHYCQGESGSGEWLCRSEEVSSRCYYCKQPNVNLIAAAPAMLRVLQDIVETLEEDEDGGQRPCEWNFESGSPLEMVEWAIREALGQNSQDR